MTDRTREPASDALPDDETALLSPEDLPVPVDAETSLFSPDEVQLPADPDRTAPMRPSRAENTVPVSGEDSLAIAWESELLGRLRSAVDGDYEVLGKLGRGGMGAVYLAQDLALNRRVAIKVMLPDLNARDKHAERFRQEARTGAALSHPNIVPVYAVSDRDDLLYFVMKYIEGRSLEAILKDAGRLPASMARSILHQVGSGLAYGHRNGVIHRDMKPANIMIDINGLAMIADFGVAKILGAQDLTMTGAAVGTPQYMSPEQCRGSRAAPASDQYSLGIVGYQMVTGTPPFQGQAIGAIITQHLFDEPPPLSEVAPDCPEDLRSTIMRMLEKAPRARFPTIDDALMGLGGDVLQHGDPARTQIIELARAVPELEPLGELTTPLSPVPTVATATQVMTAARRSSKRGFAMAVGAVVLVVSLASPVNRFFGFTTEDRQPMLERESSLTASSTDHLEDQALSRADSQEVSRPDTTLRQEESDTRRPSPPPVDREAETREREMTPAVQTGAIMLGTRGLAAKLVVNGEEQGFISRLRSWSLPIGETHVSIQMEGCVPWDSTVVIRADTETRIGYRNPGCAP